MDNRRDSKKTRSSLLRNNDESGEDDTNTLDTIELGTNGTLAMGSSFFSRFFTLSKKCIFLFHGIKLN